MTRTNTDTPGLLMIDMPMPILTPRLIIRPAMPGDGTDIHAAKVETWDDLSVWMPWAKAIGTAEETESSCREAWGRFLLREDFRMVAIDRATHEFAAMTGLHRFDAAVRRMEIGYWTRKACQGRGIATEMTIALAHYAFRALSARAVAICHASGNDASRRVIERAGFHYEGCLRNATALPDGSVQDQLWYSFTDPADVPPLDVRWGTEP